MNWTELDTWIVITGILICLACALPGTFLMLHRQSMLGDGISHAVLPGLALAFLITHSRGVLPMVVGAVAAGLLTAWLSQMIQRRGEVEAGAALGVVFCGLFALGLILIRVASDHVDLDPDCVLYGSIETSVVDVGRVPRVAWISAGLLAGNALLTALFYKELRLAAFDPALATTLGFNAEVIRLGLTLVASITTVLAFESVGSILVIAMLVVPAAAASLLTRRLHWLLVLALCFAGASAVFGHLGAITLPPIVGRWLGYPELGATSSAAMMAVAAGALFVLAWLGSWVVQVLRRRGPDALVRCSPNYRIQPPAGGARGTTSRPEVGTIVAVGNALEAAANLHEGDMRPRPYFLLRRRTSTRRSPAALPPGCTLTPQEVVDEHDVELVLVAPHRLLAAANLLEAQNRHVMPVNARASDVPLFTREAGQPGHLINEIHRSAILQIDDGVGGDRGAKVAG